MLSSSVFSVPLWFVPLLHEKETLPYDLAGESAQLMLGLRQRHLIRSRQIGDQVTHFHIGHHRQLALRHHRLHDCLRLSMSVLARRTNSFGVCTVTTLFSLA